MEIEGSKIYYSNFTQKDEPDRNSQALINSDRSSQAETSNPTKTGVGFRETRELRDSRRLWMIVSLVLLMVTLLFVCLTFYFAFNSSEHDSGTITDGTLVGRTDKDPCASSPCQNGGYCVTTGCSYHCDCPDGFSGHHCQETPCSTSPCLNGGTCNIENSTYSCRCLRGFTGSECQDTPCSDQPCMNNGTCHVTGDTYSCMCSKGYNGTRCEITPCSESPCQNGGLCSEQEGTFTCTCTSGFEGERCHMKICSSVWIQYDGRCFYLSRTKMNWFAANRYCGNLHGTFAEPKTRADIDFLKTKAKIKGFTFWIGGTDAQREGYWIWTSSKSKISPTDWHTRTIKEPNNSGGREHCMNIHKNLDFEWNDDVCSNKYRFICEKK